MKGFTKPLLLMGLIAIVDTAIADNYDLIGYDLATNPPVKAPSKTPNRAHRAPSSKSSTNSTTDFSAPSASKLDSAPGGINNSPQTEVADGLAIGMQIGVGSGMAMTNFPSNSGAGEQSRGLGTTGVAGLHLSYGYSFFNQLFLGGQIYGNLEDLSFTSHDTITQSTTWKIANNGGFVMLPGYHLDSSNLVYAKLGANYGKLSFYTANTENSSWKWASDLGFGFRQALSQNLSLALEYDWINYNDSIPQTNVFNVSGTTTSQFSQNLYLLSLDYQFDDNYPKREETAVKSLKLNGPYLGFNAGLIDQSLEDNYTSAGGSGTDRFQANGYFEQLKAGYSYQLGQWLYLGAEIFGQLAQQVEPEEYSATFNQQNQSFGASLLPGYVVNANNLLFTRIGYILTQFTGSDQGRGGHGTPYTSNISGMQFGLGYESALAPHVSFTIEYDYSYYPKFSEGPSPYNATQNYSINNNLMSIGLNYRF